MTTREEKLKKVGLTKDLESLSPEETSKLLAKLVIKGLQEDEKNESA